MVNGKLRTYLKFIKCSFEREKYLGFFRHKKNQNCTKLNHKLKVETGRYIKPKVPCELMKKEYVTDVFLLLS